MTGLKKDKRKCERYDTEIKIYFQVSYDIKTRIKYQIIKKKRGERLSRKYPGLSRNVSIKGIRFVSERQLSRGNLLFIELYLPRQKIPICMTGEVRWSKKIKVHPEIKYKYDTGVKLISVSGKPVSASIHYDKKHHIPWSIVLETIFGNFRKLCKEIKVYK